MSDELGGSDSIDGVIVTTPIPDGRVKSAVQQSIQAPKGLGLGFRL